eukprot:3535941-Prymnesium_polylepis.1
MSASPDPRGGGCTPPARCARAADAQGDLAAAALRRRGRSHRLGDDQATRRGDRGPLPAQAHQGEPPPWRAG